MTILKSNDSSSYLKAAKELLNSQSQFITEKGHRLHSAQEQYLGPGPGEFKV